MTLTWRQVRAWRLRRHLLTPLAEDEPDDVVSVVARLCGVQAQVPSAAELAVAVRQRRPERGAVGRALDERRLLRVWAMRGTLHLLPPALAPAYLALLAATRSWEKPAWQRTFLPADRLAALTEAAAAALEGRVLTREQLTAEVVRRTGDPGLAEALGSGWGAVLKPLAWQGLLCHGPVEGNRVTFTRPDTWLDGWRVPETAEAARVAVPAYLATHGPATPTAFDTWLSRGATPRRTLRGWFADLGEELAVVDVEGTPLHARVADVESLAAPEPGEVVRLLPAFDQFVLGPGTGDPHTVPPARRAEISRAAGWISPTVVTRDGVVGTWRIEDGSVDVDLFAECAPVDRDLLEAEAARLGHLLQQPSLRLTVRSS
ncbi:DNA glycosylase AlkZ-like family protein [Geodermatophilus sp. URMC 62]|uniref:DNA glycosylase AlkZ-like family protein n=1 Tax=Geodermatophilus sp. URMC 62 TaxID=3423414 RepID=UPI00406D02C0